MVISEKQIMHLIAVANAYIATVFKLGALPGEIEQVQKLIITINNQQSEELKIIE